MEVKYKPQTDKIEELLDIHRIEAREKRAQEEVDKNAEKVKEKMEGSKEEKPKGEDDDGEEGVYL